jgi:uncharacterized protein YyaL (SSP411 family)
VQKWLDWDIIEYSMAETLWGDKAFERMARETLAAQLNLMDPAWGGVYQYSTDGDWQHPHFEKIMQMQAEDLRIYAEAYALWHDNTYLQAAKQICGYLKNFLTSPEGAFYTSQDADLVRGEHGGEYFQLSDAARRQRGIPRIDKHIYSRENGWAINALATLYAFTGEQDYLDDAIRAANWIIAHSWQDLLQLTAMQPGSMPEPQYERNNFDKRHLQKVGIGYQHRDNDIHPSCPGAATFSPENETAPLKSSLEITVKVGEKHKEINPVPTDCPGNRHHTFPD